MEIVITKAEEDVLLRAELRYSEGTSRQVGKPSFFLSTDEFEVNFIAENLKEIDNLIERLQEIKSGFRKFPQG